jgi:hypothetical protein
VTPEQLAKSGTESGHQRALFAAVHADLWQWQCQSTRDMMLRPKWDGVDRSWAWPLYWLHAIPNGGSRGDSVKSRAIRGATMKAEGVKEGIPDVFLPFPAKNYAGLYIEMKKPGGKPSTAQKLFGEYALKSGYAWHLCETWEDAYAIVKKYLQP